MYTTQQILEARFLGREKTGERVTRRRRRQYTTVAHKRKADCVHMNLCVDSGEVESEGIVSDIVVPYQCP